LEILRHRPGPRHNLGTNWVQPDFDDANWNRGNARFGYGDTVAFTTISFGPDSKQKQPTTYFRTAFVVPEGLAQLPGSSDCKSTEQRILQGAGKAHLNPIFVAVSVGGLP